MFRWWVFYLQIVLSPEEASHIWLRYWKWTIQESNNVVVFPFVLHIAVQQLFKPLWSLLLLHIHEPSQVSFALCFKSLLMLLFPASEDFIGVPFSKALLSSSSYHLDLSGLGDPIGRSATASLDRQTDRQWSVLTYCPSSAECILWIPLTFAANILVKTFWPYLGMS